MREAHRQQVANVFVDQAVVDHAPRLAHGDDVLVAQDPQLMGDGGIIAPQSRCQVTYAQLARWRVQQRKDDLQTRRITQHRE